MELKELKKEYERLAGKYKLPDFREMNEEFEIQKVTEHETETLLRDIRKIMLEKILNYLRLVEVILNPSNGPMFFLLLVKGLSVEAKKEVEELYVKIGKIELESMCLDVGYDEKKEAEFLKRMCKEWKEISPKICDLSEELKKAWDRETEKKERSYFG